MGWTPICAGAVDQAEVELKYGKDPQMRALAKNIVKAQKEEIAYMKQWQAKHNKDVTREAAFGAPRQVARGPSKKLPNDCVVRPRTAVLAADPPWRSRLR
jgi:Domain of unknown function (DUF305)